MNDTQSGITPFWRFSLHLYKQPGVPDACIALQDGCGVDVNLLMYLLWLASDRRLLAVDEVKAIDQKVKSWRDSTIIPIREIRRSLKGAATLLDPNKQEAFRNKVKAVELEAERLQQEALYEITRSGSPGKEAPIKDAARANVGAYERAIDKTFPKQAVDVLINGFEKAI
jgi:uncharacterized protein (TIGR02444 family)